MESIAELVQFVPNVYGLRWQSHVGLFWTTSDGVIVVDPCGQVNPRTPFLMKEAIAAVTDQPVRYVVYSHWGADHGMGGGAFADTAQFVGHRNVVGKIAALKNPNHPAPTVVVDAHHTLQLGDTAMELYPADLYDGDDYLILNDPTAGVAVSVDFVQPRSVPFRGLFGSPEKAMALLQWIHDDLPFEHLLFGHATPHMVCTKEDVREQRQYYVDLLVAIEQAQGAPDVVAAARAALTPKYGAWRRFEEMSADNIKAVLAWRAGTWTRGF